MNPFKLDLVLFDKFFTCTINIRLGTSLKESDARSQATDQGAVAKWYTQQT
jgi:hypothetical protein